MKEEKINNYYTNSWQHLKDELFMLDMIIQLKLNEIKYKFPLNPNHEFQGIFISDQEVEQLLFTGEEIHKKDNSELHESQELIKKSIIKLDDEIKSKLEINRAKNIKISLVELSRLFELSKLEQQIIIVLLAPEIDRKYEKIYAYLQDDIRCKWPSLELFTLLFDDHKETNVRKLLHPGARLMKTLLVESKEDLRDNSITQLSKAFRLDSRIVNFLLNIPVIDERIQKVITAIHPLSEGNELFGENEKLGNLLKLINTCLNKKAKPFHLVYLWGFKGTGKKNLVKNVCRKVNKQLIITNATSLIQEELLFEIKIKRIIRECILSNSFLLIDNFDSLNEEQQQFVLEQISELPNKKMAFLFLTGNIPWFPEAESSKIRITHVEFKIPDSATRLNFWNSFINISSKLEKDIDLNEIATKFRFTPDQIKASLNTAYNLAFSGNGEQPIISKKEIYKACRMHSGKNLSQLAKLISSEYGWDDIVLPEETLRQLKGICDHVNYQNIVFNEWGFGKKNDLGKGINALLSGSSGTGKTMAATIIANDLHLSLYRIDLSQIVSKYIGETEKNLEKIFSEAESSNAILFFDEADALFGKRTEIKDSHDRYANIEISYLLQKMETYDGISLLATNMKQNIDEAFVRRLRFVIEFPFPEAVYRKEIWEKMIPGDVPLYEKIDYGLLSSQLKITGGHIKNIATNAAFLAVANSGKLSMNHLLDAARDEYKKMGRTLHNAEILSEQNEQIK